MSSATYTIDFNLNMAKKIFFFREAIIVVIYGKLNLRVIIYFLMFDNEELFLRNSWSL